MIIQIVEDDRALSDGIVLALKEPDVEFVQDATVRSARVSFEKCSPVLIILDVNLPDGSGYDYLKWVRERSQLPVLVLTANDMEMDEVMGLTLGADDYMAKPFSLAVLRARIQALVRRVKAQSAYVYEEDGFFFDFGSLIFTREGRQISLSVNEQRFLRLLVENRGRILTRNVLIDRLWSDGGEYVDENALSVTVNRLRSKLEDKKGGISYIQTIYRQGYMWKKGGCGMFGQRTLDRLDKMLDEAIAGTFEENDYDESKLSKVESKWKRFLGASALSRENVEKEKNRVKELVSDISHQTKTPMANIRLYTELLKEKLELAGAGGQERFGMNAEAGMQEDPGMYAEADGQGNTRLFTETDRQDSLKMLAEIDRQVEKLGFLIQSLTKMSRLESNIVEVKPKRQPISELLDAVIQDILPKAGQRQVEIVNNYTGSGTAYYDMKWTKEALGNIVDNAVKYSSAGSRVIISVMEYELYAAVSVKDFGAGIREEDTAKIFRRFYRAEDVHEEDGVGIGLYVAREIVRRENGYIKVKSKVGKGAEFMLYLQRSGI